MIAYEETYASLAQSLLDGIATQHPSSKHIRGILATLKEEADNADHAITASLLQSTNICSDLFETVKACRQQMQRTSDGAPLERNEWDRAMKAADALLFRFREAGNEESGAKASAGTVSSMPKKSVHIGLESKKKNRGDNFIPIANKKQAHELVSAAAPANYMLDEQNVVKQSSASTSITTMSFGEVVCGNASSILSTCISLPNPSSKLVLDTLSNLNYAIHNNGSNPLTMEMLKGPSIGGTMAHTVKKCEEMRHKMLATNAKEEYINWNRALDMAGGMVKEFIVIAKAEPQQPQQSSPLSHIDKKKRTQIELQKNGPLHNSSMAPTTQSWECPHCLDQYPFSNSLPFLRGTCKHDVCKNCIMMKATATATTSRRCNDKQAVMPSSATVLVQCPIGRCVGGFLYEHENDEVGASNMSSSKKEGNVKVSAQEKVEHTSSPWETGSESKEKQELQLNSRSKNGTSSSAVTPDSTMSLPFASSYDAETETSGDEDSNQGQKDCPSAPARQRSNRKRRLPFNDGFTSVSELPPEKFMNTPEPVPPKPFNRMNATERKEYWFDRDNLAHFFDRVMPSLEGAKCHLCEGPADPSIDKRCDKCGVFSHADCADPERGDGATCLTCRFIDSKATIKSYEDPRCHMCPHPNNSGGPLVKSSAKPVTMKVWKKYGPAALQRSIFGKNKFCHALCGMWNDLCETLNTQDGDVLIEFSEIAISNGRDHVSHQHKCFICGLNSGAKVDCCIKGCVAPGSRRTPPKFHVTCARLAGLEVQSANFTVKCFNHVEPCYVFRARLEDMREIELNRNTRKVFNASVPITWSHASSLFHTAIGVLRTLGWAWRWAEWWVEYGDNWEPLLEDDQVETEMTDKELKIVESDPQSRCNDARRCRLAAFSAAIRNREYDKEDGDDEEPLERALTAIIGTDSLVGPLKKKEINFYVTWLALAYRSKSSALGFGEDKAPVATDGFCVHQADGSPKYELGTRPLPGKAKPDKGVFEPHVKEVDDFLKTPLSSSPPKKNRKKRNSIDSWWWHC